LNNASNVEKVRELKTHVSEIHQTVFDKYGQPQRTGTILYTSDGRCA